MKKLWIDLTGNDKLMLAIFNQLTVDGRVYDVISENEEGLTLKLKRQEKGRVKMTGRD